MASSTVETTRPTHPLDPLSASEIERAWEILREARALGPPVRVIFTMLHEPAKKVVLGHRPGDAVERTACVVLVDRAEGKTYEATVSLSDGRVASWEHVPGAQPAIVLDEFVDCEAAVRADPRWQEAMRKRGVTDLSLAMVDSWSAGHFGFPADEGRRLVRALTWVRRHPQDNGYARPVANLLTVVDLNAMTVLEVVDGGVIPLPPEDAGYSPETAGIRAGLKPIEIRQPEGPSFALEGHELRWQKWRMRIGFTPREGLVQRLLGEVEVAEEPDQRREDAARLGPVDRLDPVARPRGRLGGHRGGVSRAYAASSRSGRTSMQPRRTGGMFDATRMASFRSRASMSMKPPSCSFVSAKGPSVVETRPFRIRMVVAVSTGWRPSETM
jgi:primary-amine oxidase